MSKQREKMPVKDRAKQFMPFAAVKGLEEALEKKRRERLQAARAELSQDMEDALNESLLSIRKGDPLAVTFYQNGLYITLEGTAKKVDPLRQFLALEEEEIPFSDILRIERR